jgi:microsomal dipeptidase-like Zn-dependent dipeptidase
MASKRKKRKRKKAWTAHEIREVVRAIDDFLEVGDEDGIAFVFDFLDEPMPWDMRFLPDQLRWLRAVLKLYLKPREKL